MPRWSNLQKLLYDLFDSNLNLQIHCCVYRSKINFPRYWISLDNEIIWDFPKDYFNRKKEEENLQNDIELEYKISEIPNIIREYINTPIHELMNKNIENDKYGLTEILLVADRRIGN